jgi:phosphoribosylanthranilate isomerase
VSVRIKVCGVTRVEDAEMAIALGAEMIGLNFYAPSPRALSIERARALCCAIAGRAIVIGVFVNASRDYIEARLRELRLDMLQFHGDEDESALRGWPVKVIRALRLRVNDPATTAPSTASSQMPAGTAPNIAGQTDAVLPNSIADYLLLDTYHPGLYGGSGLARPLDGLERLDLTRVFLSGGLTPVNVACAAALNPYAVDVASGVESAPGIKDPDKLRSFIANAKSPR